MVDNAFKKACWITDQHFGRSGNSCVANQDNIEFIYWAIDRAKSWGAETCILGGDLFHNRNTVGVHTMHYALDAMDMINAAFPKTFLIQGNHDCLYREKRDITSLEFARNFPNVNIIRDPTSFDGITLLPWLVADEHRTIENIRSRYVFGHLEMPGFLMNASVILPDSPTLVKPDQFRNIEYVISGHFHIRQEQTFGSAKILFTGSIMPFDFGDADDPDRGMMLLEWGKDPIFESWPEQPMFIKTNLSEMIENPAMLRSKMSVKASVDIPLMFEEAEEIRDALMTTYDLRKIELLKKPADNVENQSFSDDDVVFRSVDQMVIDGLMSIESAGLSKEKLVSIYRQIAEI